MSWIAKAVLSMLCMVPMFMLPKIMGRFGVAPEAVSFFWGVGVLTGIPLLLLLTQNIGVLTVSNNLKLIIIGCGLVFGTAASILMYQALALAPNSGMVIPILNCATIVVFAIGILLSVIAPEKFPAVALNYKQVAGLVMVFTGIVMVFLYNTPPTSQ